ncbi:MAG: hypothetical protein IJT75_05970 [Bacteroidaceae bacterium]|nr:hypothetical protein [Bacteroidaceae bacterium]
MKPIIRMALAAATLSFAVSATAQNSNSSYFMEGAVNRHMVNPAFAPQQGYVAMPALGNFNIDLSTNFNIGDMLFQRNGKTVTFLHPDVTKAEALGGLEDVNKFRTDINLQILGVGFRAFGGYNTITVSSRTFAGFKLPYDLFSIAKDLENRSYHVSDASVFGQSFAEVALGHSRQITEDLRLGAKLKVLVGIARVKAELSDLDLNLTADQEWTATAHATVEANMKGLKITEKSKDYKQTDTNGNTRTYTTIDDFKTDDFKPIGGMGFAVDLGGEYDFKELVPGLKASLAILDLGFINWAESHTVANHGDPFTFNGFSNIQVKDGSGEKFSDQTDRLVDDITDLYRLENKGDQGSNSYGIGTTLNVGVEYALPWYDKVRVGLLSSSRFQENYGWNEERLSANYAPCHWFDMNVNGAIGTFGPSFGWMLNLHPVGFNLYLAMDRTLGKVSKQFAPMNKGTQFSMGINFPLQSARKKIW